MKTIERLPALVKVCSKCKEGKLLSEFSVNKRLSYGVNDYCKTCDRIRQKERRDKKDPKTAEERRRREERKTLFLRGLQRCFKCKNIKTLEETARDVNQPDGYKGICKACSCIATSISYNKKQSVIEARNLKNKLEEERDERLKRGEKLCSGCNLEILLADFPDDKKSIDGKACQCRSCQNQVCSNYRKRNPEKKKESSKKFAKKERIENPERVKAREKLAKEKNPEKYRAIKTFHQNKRRKKLTNAVQGDKTLMKVFYLNAQRLTSETGIKHVVDHTFPVSRGGPNHEGNLQTLTEANNARKHNSLDFYDEGVHWTQLKTHVLEMIEPAKLLAAYKEIGKKPPKRIAAHLTGLI